MNAASLRSILSRCLAILIGLTAPGMASLADQAGTANTRFHPGQPWPDTDGVHLNAHGFCLLDFGGRHYWYGSHKIAGKTEAEKNEAGVRCYVSDDLLNWQNVGLVLSVFAPGAHPDLADASILDRPKVIYHAATKKFLLYFKLYPPKSQGGKTGTDYAYVGVATATAPTGPFHYQGRFLGGNSPFGTGDFTIFSDTDGSVYHLGVRKPDKAHVCGRLAEDGLRPAGDYVELAGITRSTEAPALFRRGTKIFFLGSGSSGWYARSSKTAIASCSASCRSAHRSIKKAANTSRISCASLFAPSARMAGRCAARSSAFSCATASANPPAESPCAPAQGSSCPCSL